MITENGLINGERFFNGSSNKRSVSPDFAHNEHNKDFEVKHQKKKKKKNPIKLTVPWLTTDGLTGLETSRGGAMFKGGGWNFEILKIYIIILMFSKFSLQK